MRLTNAHESAKTQSVNTRANTKKRNVQKKSYFGVARENSASAKY